MSVFSYIPPERSARRRAQSSSAQGVVPPDSGGLRRPKVAPERRAQHRNVEAVLSLGATRYFTVRGRIYCIPPVPFPLGQRVLDVYATTTGAASSVAMDGSRKDEAKRYLDGLDQLAKLMWKHIRPIGVVRRMLYRLRLLQNPLRALSEKEMQEVTDFFLQGRMKSSVSLMPDTRLV